MDPPNDNRKIIADFLTITSIFVALPIAQIAVFLLLPFKNQSKGGFEEVSNEAMW